MSKLSEKNTSNSDRLIIKNPWQSLKQFTSARIGLGRVGNSIPTNELLAFQLDHARAIDAVHKALDVKALLEHLSTSQPLYNATPMNPIVLDSKARDRMEYLQRPDLGRQLSDASWQQLLEQRSEVDAKYDLAIVVADGLSSTAIQNHAVPLLDRLVEKLGTDPKNNWSLAPLTIVSQGRVAIGDDVGECLNAKITMILIGERPGLTSPDSMGIYMTWAPKRGAKESSRNCISNIRPEGLGYDEASNKAFYLLSESIRRQISGIKLKDRSSDNEDNDALESSTTTSHFLISP
ncbi:ethanolamine ammonia-lyase subunit EutC [Vibrio algarum]|uniref:Ethanolamine ammonia-lyase small subunit n=1 Tax=Vibrio algarum TaxID=3020714 RepID=A0ABT4YVR7_9VIBR|nr:ethanolamine ammonia-lyase subunit EutC [Vibrio sp. KJ40-1]MDB1125674.1 ethanolamine ammonia-lyase subunit EutC [Vibrio sp. KJ40-1]